MTQSKSDQSKRWVITTSGERPIHDVAQHLKKAGLAVDQVLEEVGSITGSADESVVAKLQKVPGVADVSPELQFNIGPPDSPVSW